MRYITEDQLSRLRTRIRAYIDAADAEIVISKILKILEFKIADCPVCGMMFEPKRKDSKYCSRKCGSVARQRAYSARQKAKES